MIKSHSPELSSLIGYISNEVFMAKLVVINLYDEYLQYALAA
jgi:hypothetical protein